MPRLKRFPKLIDDNLPEAKWDAGRFVLHVDDKGHRFWKGSSPGDKGATSFAPGQPLELSPEQWPPGTVIAATTPDDEDAPV